CIHEHSRELHVKLPTTLRRSLAHVRAQAVANSPPKHILASDALGLLPEDQRIQLLPGLCSAPAPDEWSLGSLHGRGPRLELLSPNDSLSSGGGRVSYELQNAYMPPRSAAAPGSALKPLCGSLIAR